MTYTSDQRELSCTMSVSVVINSEGVGLAGSKHREDLEALQSPALLASPRSPPCSHSSEKNWVKGVKKQLRWWAPDQDASWPRLLVFQMRPTYCRDYIIDLVWKHLKIPQDVWDILLNPPQPGSDGQTDRWVCLWSCRCAFVHSMKLLSVT